MTDLDWSDLLDLRATLTDEARLVQESVARFIDADVVPLIGQCFAEHRFPSELVPALAELGLLGMTIEWPGHARLGYTEYGLACQELERGDSSIRSFVSVQSSLVMGCIDAFGSDAQKAYWLPELASGRKIGCFGLTEAQGGSDPGHMMTRAGRKGGDWRLDGSKIWITNGGIADLAVIWARTEEGIRAFLVERGTSGYEARTIEHKLSLRASDTGALYLDAVRLPEEARLPNAEGLGAALSCLNVARFGICFGAVGAARACFAEALDYSRSRRLFGRTLAETQLVQQRLAEMARGISTAELLAHRLGQLADQGRVSSAQISLGKWNNVKAALDIARDCRDLLGAAGITADHVAIRHMLNLETVKTYEGTESVHALIVGKGLTGHTAF